MANKDDTVHQSPTRPDPTGPLHDRVRTIGHSSRSPHILLSLVLLLPVLVDLSIAQGGWMLKSTSNQNSPIHAVAIAGPHTAFSVGIRGNVLRSTNKGASWSPLWTGNNTPLRAVCFPETGVGTAAGDYGVVLRTTDAGRSWERQTNGSFTSNVHFTGVGFSDRDHGIAVGRGGDLYRTIDGGSMWSAIPLPGIASFLNAVSFRDASAMAVGDGGRIVYSPDGGESWISRAAGGGENLYSVWVVDSARAFVAGTGTIRRTTDGGLTWTTVPEAGSLSWRTIYFIDSSRGFAASSEGWILSTNDGGMTWESRLSYIVPITDAGFFDSTAGIVTTMAGFPAYTNDGGETWQTSVVLDGISFHGVSAIGPASALVVGDEGTIIRTDDAAQTWTTLKAGTAVDLFAIDCLDSSTCAVVGDFGLFLRSTDSGTTWTLETTGYPQALRSVDFTSPSTGIAVGDDGRILRTTDGGTTWLPRPGGAGFDLYSVAFQNPSLGIIAGDSVALRTVDGGLSWQNVTLSPSFRYRAASFPSQTLGIVGGFFGPEPAGNHNAVIHSTTNGGATWRYSSGILSFGEIHDISAPDTAHIFATGRGGDIYRSTNTGLHWMSQTTQGSSTLLDISMYDSTHGFAVGKSETIQYTTDGGLFISPPYPYSPNYGTILQLPQAIVLSWGFYSSGVLSCRLQISTEQTFQSGIVLDTTMPGAPTALTVPGPAYGRQYFWRLSNWTTAGGGQWSSVSKFSTMPYVTHDVEGVQKPRSDNTLGVYLTLADSNQNSNPGYYWTQSTPLNPADTIRLKAVCAVPPGEFQVGGVSRMVVYDADTALDSWRGIIVDIVAPAGPGFSGIQPGDSVTLVGTVAETPSPSVNSLTVFRATGAVVSGAGVVLSPISVAVSDFYLDEYPSGMVRYSRGEQYEGMLVELSDLLVASEHDTASGSQTLTDGAGNSFTMTDDSRWFTVRGHRDPASLYSPPAPGAFIRFLRGLITILPGTGSNRGYCIAPVYPEDIVFGTPHGGLIEGKIFQDLNNDSLRAFPDKLASRMLVFLTGKNSLTAFTGTDGRFRFDRLDSGTFSVTTEQRPGWVFTTPANGVHTLALPENGASTGHDIGTYFRGGFITGTVFEDLDGDSVRDPGEPGLPGRTVRLTGGAADSTITDASGNYHFERLPNGSFKVGIKDQLYWWRTAPATPGDRPASVTSADLTSDGIDFGYSFCVKLRFKIVVDDVAGFTHDLWWGIRPGASTGFWLTDTGATRIDSLEGEFEIPPREFAKMVGIFDARFHDPHYPLEEESPHFGQGGWTDVRDFRSFGQVDTFLVSFLPSYLGGGGYPMTLRWDPAAIARSFNGPVFIDDGHGAVADMKSTGEFVVTDDSISSCLLITNEPAISEDWISSWQLVSLPVHPGSPGVRAIYPSATGKAYSFDPLIGYRQNDTLVAGMGYWLHYQKKVDTLAIEGVERSVDTVDVWEGWNLVGTLSTGLAASSARSDPPDLLSGLFYGYQHGYFLADSLLPGMGYWVRSAGDGAMVLDVASPAPAPRQGRRMTIVEQVEGANILKVGNPAGGAMSLYFCADPQQGDPTRADPFELPPPPPAGEFDARFATQRILETVSEGDVRDIPVVISSPRYPVTLSWEMLSFTSTATLTVGPRMIPLRDDGAVELSGGDVTVVLTLRGTPGLPGAFTLHQNYPNPFNPATVIRYDLPAEAAIELIIYDILGREIRRIVNEVQPAGFFSREWDGTNEAGVPVVSGIYFYRILAHSSAAGSFTDIRKMILLK